MIIDKTVHQWLLDGMYGDETHMRMYGQHPVGIRYHLGVIDNHEEMKKAYESDDEFYIDDLMRVEVTTKRLRELRKTGAYIHENNEAFDLEICTPKPMKAVKNDHWEYLRTKTWWGKRGLTVLGFCVHTYIPEEQCSYVLFWNWVYQEFLLKNRIKTARPSSTINSDDDIQTVIIPHEGLDREVLVVTSTENKYRNHTEALKDAKIFIDSDSPQPKVIYK